MIDLISKIESKAKNFLFFNSKNYKNQGESLMPYESIIAFSQEFPNSLFLINKNIIFNKGIEDSSYDIWKFDKKGNYKKLNPILFDKKFFRELQTVKKI